MGKVKVRIALRNAVPPNLKLLPVGHENVTLLVQKGDNVTVIPIRICDVGLHVHPPLVWKTSNEDPFLLLGTQEGLLKTPIDLPLLHEGSPMEALTIP